MRRLPDGVGRIAPLPDEGDIVGDLVPDRRCGPRAGRCQTCDGATILRLDHDELRRRRAASNVSATTNAIGSPTARMRSRTSIGRWA